MTAATQRASARWLAKPARASARWTCTCCELDSHTACKCTQEQTEDCSRNEAVQEVSASKLTATSTAHSNIWQAVDGAEVYRVDREKANGSAVTVARDIEDAVDGTAAVTMQTVVHGLGTGKESRLRVHAGTRLGYETVGTGVTVTVLAAPERVQVSSVAARSVVVQWSSVAGAQVYRVEKQLVSLTERASETGCGKSLQAQLQETAARLADLLRAVCTRYKSAPVQTECSRHRAARCGQQPWRLLERHASSAKLPSGVAGGCGSKSVPYGGQSRRRICV
eukprot:c8551_g1_i1.p1 GENE.c8551_g1_i1~~c8551_g1_i1.p1  ORF type:complete len:280 (+),score=32.90 c8551_g1_i1:1149-1988(+)